MHKRRQCRSSDLLLLLDPLRQPVNAVVQALAVGSAGGLHMPRVGGDLVHLQAVGDLLGAQSVGKILLVGEDEHNGSSKLGALQHLPQLEASLLHAVHIVTIYNEDNSLCVKEVVPPQSADLVLTADIPDGELNCLAGHGLDVESDRRRGLDDLSHLKLIQDSGLSGVVESKHNNPLLLALLVQELEQLAHASTHFRSPFSVPYRKVKTRQNKKD
mmetsp:Transcript_19158/g.73623  ORF Transcript_19158/g.73623 Transcript_19158/m.73623 type:complete len:215 (-) Transcript_19158:73-717(-)